MKNYIALLFCIIPFFCIGQRIHFNQFSNEQGLSQSQVQFMFEDSRGHLWITTNGGGINRYDGNRFETFTTDDGLHNDFIGNIIEDENNDLWLTTSYESGLARFDGKKFSIYSTETGMPSDQVIDIKGDNKGNMWVATDSGLVCFNLHRQDITIFTTADGLPDNQITNIFEDHEGTLWFHSRSSPGMAKWENGKFKPFLINGQIFQDTVVTTCLDKSNNIWIQLKSRALKMLAYDEANDLYKMVAPDTIYPNCPSNIKNYLLNDGDNNLYMDLDEGFAFFDGKQFRTLTTEDGLIDNHYDGIKKDGAGGIWFVKNRVGVCHYTGQGFTTYPTDKKYIDTYVNFILTDNQGTVWLGTNGGGAIQYPSLTFSYFDNDAGLASNIVFAINQDQHGDMWFGTYGRGVSVFDGKKFKTYDSKNGLSGDNVWSIAKDKHNNMWIGTSKGLVKYDGKKFQKFGKQEGIPIDEVFVVYIDSKDRIWLATSESAVTIFENGKATLLDKEEGINNIIYAFSEDKDGNIWMGSDGDGLYKYDESGITNISTKDGLVNDYVAYLMHDDDDNLWIGTQGGGINKYDGNKFTVINQSKGLSNNAVMSMIFDDEGNLWAGTNNGLNKIRFNKNGSVSEIESFGKLEGFIGIECNSGASFNDKDGNLWFGSSVLVKYSANEDKLNTTPPQLHLTGIKLFHKNLDLTLFADSISPWFHLPKNLNLPYDQNHLTFEYIGISLKVPEKTMYQYKLDGFDEDWSPYTSQTEVVYPNIEPGDYTFMVMARNDAKFWNDEPLKIYITISHPFWSTWWFYMLCIIAGISTVYGIIRWRIKSIKASKIELEHKVTLRTQTITEQKNELQQAYNEITSSIEYARRIQESILPLDSALESLLPNAFVLYRPKDIVSGDFYWLEQRNDKILLAAVDCTGHGVPGAFMSIMGHSKLNQVANQIDSKAEAAAILNALNVEVTKTLKGDSVEESSRDGMDVTFCSIDLEKKELQYAGAYNPLYLIREGELQIIKGDKFPIGIVPGKTTQPFTNHTIPLQKNDTFYLFSDGYIDQFGGPKNKKYLSRRFKEFLVSTNGMSMTEQRAALEENLDLWMGDNEQVDDILVIGIRV